MNPETFLLLLESKTTGKIRNAHPPFPVKRIAILKIHIHPIFIHTLVSLPTYGSRLIQHLITRYVVLSLHSQISIGFQQEITSPYRRTASYTYEQSSFTKSSYPRQLDVNTIQFSDAHHRKFPPPASSVVETEQKIWWEKIMRTHT